MFDEKINTIKKLGELECTIYEFSTAIFLRENTFAKDEQMKKLLRILDNEIIKTFSYSEVISKTIKINN